MRVDLAREQSDGFGSQYMRPQHRGETVEVSLFVRQNQVHCRALNLVDLVFTIPGSLVFRVVSIINGLRELGKKLVSRVVKELFFGIGKND